MSTNGRANIHPSPAVPPSAFRRWAVIFVLLAGSFFALAYYLSTDIRVKVRANEALKVRE